MRVLPFLFVIFFLTSVLAVPVPLGDSENGEERLPALSSDWRVELIAHHKGSAPPDIALDSSNRPHVLYCPPGEVDLAIREPPAWINETVFGPTGVGGVCGVLSLDPLDNPFVGYDRLAHKTGGGWNYAPVPWPPYDMAVSSAGTVHLTYFKRTASDEVKVQEAFLLEGNWTVEDVDTLYAPSTIGSGWLSLALGAAFNPHILYYADAIKEVRYAHKVDGTWTTEVVDTAGDIFQVGRQGSIILTQDGVGAAYVIRSPDGTRDLWFSIRQGGLWQGELVEDSDFAVFPSLAVDGQGNIQLTYERIIQVSQNPPTYDDDLLHATRTPSDWEYDSAYDGHILLNSLADPWDDDWNSPTFPTMAMDECGNPHIAFYLSWRQGRDDSQKGAYYLTKGEPCPPEPEEEPSIFLDIDPHTLNLKSNGRWTTAYLSVENASVHDIDASTILLQDALMPERWDYQDDILMLKFSRQDLIAILEVGESVEIKLSGKWNDGSDFEAYDYIRVIDPGKK